MLNLCVAALRLKNKLARACCTPANEISISSHDESPIPAYLLPSVVTRLGPLCRNIHGVGSGGRLYFTALACMTLEVYYRYMPLYRPGSVEEKGTRD